jgi:tetratricopeptide (TPR) repeat protein
MSETPGGIRWRATAIGIAGCLAYSNSLSGPFVFDDTLSIVENLQIRQWWRLRSVLFPDRELPVAGRPLVNASFAINYAIGGLGVAGYHAVNVGCHLLCALLVFGVVRRTLELPGPKPRFGPWSRDLAFGVALLWALHPLNTEAVDYVTQRTELMMGLFYLLTLYAGLRAWQSARARPWQAIAVASCAAGMACKESMVTAPLLVVLYDGVFLFGSLKRAVRHRWRLYAGLAMSWVVLAAVMWSGPRIHSAGFSSGVSSWTYLLNQTLMLTRYLRLAVWPRSLVLVYGWPLSLTLGDVLPYALLVAALLALTIVAAVRAPKWGFLGVWFFLTLAPTSSIVPIATEVGAERRMYLPLIAVIALPVVALPVVTASFIRRMPSPAAWMVLVICSAALAAGTFARNREYASGLVLASTSVDRHPSSVARHYLANELAKVGREDEAMLHLRQALPGAPGAHYSLGGLLFKRGEWNEAIDELQAFVRERPMLLEAVVARQLLGRAFAKQQRWQEAIEQYRMVLAMNPSRAQWIETQGLLGVACFGAQRFGEAVVHLGEYVKAGPPDAVALNDLAVSLVATSRLDDAIVVFRRAVDVNPYDGGLQLNLANALFDHRDADEAAAHAEQAVALRPGDPAAHDVLGRALAVQGKLADARSQFERALQIAPGDADVREHLTRLERFAAGRAISGPAPASRRQ